MKRIFQVLKYGWKHAGLISKEISGVPRISIFIDILKCFKKYQMWSNQYYSLQMWNLNETDRQEKGKEIKKINQHYEIWKQEFFKNFRFLNKWISYKYEVTGNKKLRRSKAYQKHYNIGKHSFIGVNVIIQKPEVSISSIIIGENCYLGDNINIDYTGGLTIDNNVSISENTKILTHNHELEISKLDKREVIPTPLHIYDNVWIGAHSIILPFVKSIGRYANIGAGSVVRHMVPPYSILIGNPAKIIGFLFTPDEVVEFERDRYDQLDKTDIEKYKKIYDKYYISRIAEIKEFLKK